MSIIKTLLNSTKNNTLLTKGIKDTGFYALSILLGRSLTILVIPYLAIKLTIKEIGYYDLFLIGTNYIQLFLTLGIDSGIAIKIANHKEDKDRLALYFSISIAITVLIALFVAIVLLPLFYMFKDYELSFVLLMVIQGFLMAIQYVAYNYFKWLGESKKASFLMSVGYGIGVVLGVIFINTLGTSLTQFLLGIVIGNFFGVIITIFISYSYINFSFKKEDVSELKSLLYLSIPFFFNSLLNQSYKAADRFIILSFLNHQILGVYSLIVRVCQIPVMGIEVALNAFQAITFVNYKTKEGIQLYNKILNFNLILINILVVLFTMTLYFVSPYVPGLDALKSYVYLTPLIVLNISFISIKMYGGFSYYIENKTIYITYITLIALVTYIILAILLSRFGIMGITFSAAFVSIGSTYSFYYFSNKIKSFNENMNFILVLCIVSFFITSMLTVFMYNLT